MQYVQQEIKKQVAKPAKHYDHIPSKIMQEIGSYALIHRAKAAIDRFSIVHTKYSLKRTTVNGWKERCKNHSIVKRGRPNLVDDEMLKKIKDFIIGLRPTHKVIFRKMVLPIGTSIVKTNKPKILREFGGSLKPTIDWT